MLETITDPSVRDVRHFRYHVALDNHEPTRDFHGGDLEFYTTDTVTDGALLFGSDTLRDARKSLYLLDDGTSVRPYYVAGWKPSDPEHDRWGEHGVNYIMIHPFPTNVDADGSPILRPDGRPVDFSNWLLGPSRAYHLKIRPA